MKKQTRITLFLSVICVALFAALPSRAQFSAGARAGANLATEPYDNYYHVFLARPYVGVYGAYQLGIPVFIHLGVNFSAEGANLKDLSSGTTFQIRQSYLNIPLLAQYKFGFGGYIEAGPQLGFLLSANSSINNGTSTDNKQYYKSTEFSGGLGIGYDFNHKQANGLGISVRYMRGISAINNTSTGGGDVKNRVLSIGLTYRLGTKTTKK